MKKIFVKSIKNNWLQLLNIFINRYNHWLAKIHIDKYPQVAIFSFDHIGLKINNEGRYENRDLLFILDYLKLVIPFPHRSSVLDIGANIGNHSIFFSDFFEIVYAFEPNPRTFELLKINSDHACINKNIKCFNYGLSNKNGQFFFHSNGLNVGGSRIIDSSLSDSNDGDLLVDVKRADDLSFLLESDISLIKIDIEGHELTALIGAYEIIKKNKPVILFEQNKDYLTNGSSPVVDYLKELNYKFLIVDQSFNYGDGIIFNIIGLFLRAILGYKLILVETDCLENRSYDMIIAVQK